ncbi:hypothetical protein BO82DRAFT_295259, partial [Aspergillus uvarum CBS 121591]
DFLQCTHVPFVLDPPSQAESARLRAHIAKQNPQVKALLETAPKNDDQPPEILTQAQKVLVLFTGSHHHYVTPKFYTQRRSARWRGKVKMSQEMRKGDREGVVRGFAGLVGGRDREGDCGVGAREGGDGGEQEGGCSVGSVDVRGYTCMGSICTVHIIYGVHVQAWNVASLRQGSSHRFI